MSTNFRNDVAYGLSQSLLDISLRPIVSNRAPTSNDFAPIGSLWVDKSVDNAYILVNISNGAASWSQIDNSGGGGAFSSLTVTPGPVDLTGATTINGSGAATTTIGTGGTGVVNLGNNTGGVSMNGTVSVTGGQLTISSGVDGIGISALPTVGPAASPLTLNGRFGQASFSDVIAGAANATLRVNNTSATANSAVIASVSCTTAGAILVIGSTVAGAGTIDFDVYNVSAATATAAPIQITYWVLNS